MKLQGVSGEAGIREGSGSAVSGDKEGKGDGYQGGRAETRTRIQSTKLAGRLQLSMEEKKGPKSLRDGNVECWSRFCSDTTYSSRSTLSRLPSSTHGVGQGQEEPPSVLAGSEDRLVAIDFLSVVIDRRNKEPKNESWEAESVTPRQVQKRKG